MDKVLIFDFDGTIADSLPVLIKVYHELLPDKPELTKAQIRSLRGMKLTSIPGYLGIAWWRVPFLVRTGRRRMHKHMSEVEVFDGMAEVIETLHARGYTLLIGSSNSAENVKKFLKIRGLYTYFDGIYGHAGIFSKAGALRKILRRSRLQPENTYYIGDEVKDSVAAHEVGMPNISVTWGFNDKASLAATNPTKMVDEPHELLKIFT